MPGLYDTVFVDEVRAWDAVDYILGGNAVIGVMDEGPRVISVVDEAFYKLGVVAGGHGDTNHDHFVFVLIIDFLHLRHLGAARRAPGAPEVDEHGLTTQRGQLHRLVVSHVYQGKVGRDIAYVKANYTRSWWFRWLASEKPQRRSKHRKE